MRCFLFCIACLSFLSVRAQSAWDAPGARSISMGGVVLLKEDLWNGMGFPALLPKHSDKRSLALTANNRFGVENLSEGALVFNLAKGSYGASVFTRSLGNADFSLSHFGLGMGAAFAHAFSVGFSFSYSRLYAAHVGVFAFPSLLFSVYLPVNESLHLGVRFANPMRLQQLAIERGLPANAGGVFSISKKMSQAVETVIECAVTQGMLLDLRVGIEYRMKGKSAFRSGFALRNQSFSMGFTFDRAFPIVLAFSYHNRLGMSPALDFGYVSKAL